MEKIIILTGNSRADDWLITRLSMLFPECEIEILSRRPESFKEDRLSLLNNTCRAQGIPTKIRKGSRRTMKNLTVKEKNFLTKMCLNYLRDHCFPPIPKDLSELATWPLDRFQQFCRGDVEIVQGLYKRLIG